MSRPTKGSEHVEGIEGSDLARRRLRWVLETLSGAATIDAACADLGISPARFAQIRETALSGAAAALEPRPLGRPAALPLDPEVESLREQVRELRRDVEASRIREEIAIVMPHVLRPRESGEKGGDGAGRGGRRGT
jgi:hypothetical protein